MRNRPSEVFILAALVVTTFSLLQPQTVSASFDQLQSARRDPYDPSRFEVVCRNGKVESRLPREFAAGHYCRGAYADQGLLIVTDPDVFSNPDAVHLETYANELGLPFETLPELKFESLQPALARRRVLIFPDVYWRGKEKGRPGPGPLDPRIRSAIEDFVEKGGLVVAAGGHAFHGSGEVFLNSVFGWKMRRRWAGHLGDSPRIAAPGALPPPLRDLPEFRGGGPEKVEIWTESMPAEGKPLYTINGGANTLAGLIPKGKGYVAFFALAFNRLWGSEPKRPAYWLEALETVLKLATDPIDGRSQESQRPATDTSGVNYDESF